MIAVLVGAERLDDADDNCVSRRIVFEEKPGRFGKRIPISREIFTGTCETVKLNSWIRQKKMWEMWDKKNILRSLRWEKKLN